MRVTLDLDVCLTRKPKVRPVSLKSWDMISPSELAALREWLGRASPGDYLNADGTILPKAMDANVLDVYPLGSKKPLRFRGSESAPPTPGAPGPMNEAQGERIIASLGEVTRELARIRAENGELVQLLMRKLVA